MKNLWNGEIGTETQAEEEIDTPGFQELLDMKAKPRVQIHVAEDSDEAREILNRLSVAPSWEIEEVDPSVLDPFVLKLETAPHRFDTGKIWYFENLKNAACLDKEQIPELVPLYEEMDAPSKDDHRFSPTSFLFS